MYNLITEIAASNGSQIVAASHSEVVLQEAAERDVVMAFVGAPHRIDTRARRGQVKKALESIRMADYYLAEQKGWMLYVEGSTDLAILRRLAQRLGRPSARLHDNQQQLSRLQHRLQTGWLLGSQQRRNRLRVLEDQLPSALQRSLKRQQERLHRCELSLGLLDPQLVLERGYAFLTDTQGLAVTRAAQVQAGQALTATLADGTLDVRVEPPAQRP